MEQGEVAKLRTGFYLILWKEGGYSYAAVGVTRSGDKWLAPLNWVSPTEDPDIWKEVGFAWCLFCRYH